MNKNYTYEVTKDGYFILENGTKVRHQYEPYIPNHNISYEENAKLQIKGMQINDYTTDIINKKITIEDVPEELQEEVKVSIKKYEEEQKRQPATKEDYEKLQSNITDIELALAEIYESEVQ